MRSLVSDRSAGIDAVRILGVLAIVAGHVWTRPITADWFYPWHVPVFLILSGYLWKPDRTFRSEFRGRLLSLGRPYIAWLGILTVALLMMGSVSHEPVGIRVLEGFYGGGVAILPYTTLWFVSALFFTALLYRAVSRLPMWGQWAFGICGAAAGHTWGPALSEAPLGIGYAVTCLIYLVIGATFAGYRARIPVPFVSGTVAVLVGAALVFSGWSAPLDIKLGDYGTPIWSIVSASLISIGLVLIAERIFRPGRFSRVITFLALPMLTVVLAHPVFLWLPGPLWFKFIAAVCVPLAIGLLASRTRIAPWIAGRERLVPRRDAKR